MNLQPIPNDARIIIVKTNSTNYKCLYWTTDDKMYYARITSPKFCFEGEGHFDLGMKARAALLFHEELLSLHYHGA